MDLQPVAFNWLHLSDLHWNMDGQDILWPNVQDKFYESLTEIYDRCGPWNAVLFTGDLVQRGVPEQFVKLQEKVLDPLFAHIERLQPERPVFLAVPGNHDLEWPKEELPSAALKFLLNPELFDF
jgi:3',5'-cyclic AMP phosphodiesterase CpdA